MPTISREQIVDTAVILGLVKDGSGGAIVFRGPVPSGNQYIISRLT